VVRILAKLIIIFILVYTGVSIWYGRLEGKLQKNPVSRVAAVAPPPEKKTEILRKPDDYTIIVRRNIFQAVVVKTEQDTTKEEPEELKPTKLKLSLMGTISGNERDARAIISDDAKRQQDIYQVGDSVQGAIIKTIERGKIVLTVNSKDEVLTLKDRQGGGKAYQPSPSDYYKEPLEQQKPQVGKPPSTPGKRRPVVRPRPVRRSVTPHNRRLGSGSD
jgi:general secretion pathway protein C